MEAKELYIYMVYFQGDERVVSMNTNVNTNMIISTPLIFKTKEDAQEKNVVETVQKLCDNNNTTVELVKYTLQEVVEGFHGNNMNIH